MDAAIRVGMGWDKTHTARMPRVHQATSSPAWCTFLHLATQLSLLRGAAGTTTAAQWDASASTPPVATVPSCGAYIPFVLKQTYGFGARVAFEGGVYRVNRKLGVTSNKASPATNTNAWEREHACAPTTEDTSSIDAAACNVSMCLPWCVPCLPLPECVRVCVTRSTCTCM